jgi:hypothetical protein
MHHRIAKIGLVVSLFLLAGCQQQTPLEEASELLYLKQYDPALEICDRVLRESPDDFEARLLRGQINQKAERLDEALADFSKAIDIDPSNAEGFYYRAKLYGVRKELDKQLDDEQSAFERDPQFRVAMPTSSTQTAPLTDFYASDADAAATGASDLAADEGVGLTNEPNPLDPSASDSDLAPELGRSAAPPRPGGAVGQPPTPEDLPTMGYAQWLAMQAEKTPLLDPSDLPGLPAGQPELIVETPTDLEADELPETTAPPSPPVTRFGFPLDGPAVGGDTARRSVSTGIQSLNDSPETRGRFFLQDADTFRPGLGLSVPRGPSTGIVSNPPASPLPTLLPTLPMPTTGLGQYGTQPAPPSWGLNGPARFFTPRGSGAAAVGPRGIGQTANGLPTPSANPSVADRPLPTTALPGTSSFSMALPGTEIRAPAFPAAPNAVAPNASNGQVRPANDGRRSGITPFPTRRPQEER